jgi:hypothetical protein
MLCHKTRILEDGDTVSLVQKKVCDRLRALRSMNHTVWGFLGFWVRDQWLGDRA